MAVGNETKKEERKKERKKERKTEREKLTPLSRHGAFVRNLTSQTLCGVTHLHTRTRPHRKSLCASRYKESHGGVSTIPSVPLNPMRSMFCSIPYASEEANRRNNCSLRAATCAECLGRSLELGLEAGCLPLLIRGFE
jgi:hypothetical protein